MGEWPLIVSKWPENSKAPKNPVMEKVYILAAGFLKPTEGLQVLYVFW